MKRNTCVDAGSIYCPCHLAETKDCILCTQLKGEGLCDCRWQGVCIYQNYLKNKNDINRQRMEELCEIKKKTEFEKDIYLLEIQIPHELALELINPGSYIFLRGENRSSESFNSPISVMNVDLNSNLLTIVIGSLGPKTKDLLKNDKVYVKGPYKNGIFGLKYFKSMKEKKVVLISKGLSQVTLINVINQLLKNNNVLKIFMDQNGKMIPLVQEKIKSLENVDIQYVDFEKDIDIIKNEIRNDVALVYSAGSNYFNREIMNIVDVVDDKIPLSITNNNLICCGEGLCGACIVKMQGENIRTCKTQVEPRVYLKEALK